MGKYGKLMRVDDSFNELVNTMKDDMAKTLGLNDDLKRKISSQVITRNIAKKIKGSNIVKLRL